jgi:hypothetical protein
MAPPIDEACQRDAGGERDGDHGERVRAAVLTRALAVLRRRGRDHRLTRREIRGRLAACACGYEARLEAAEEGGVLCERLSESRTNAACSGRTLSHLLQALGAPLDEQVTPVATPFGGGWRRCHFFAGGASPVAMRQIREATRRAPTVAAAPMPA